MQNLYILLIYTQRSGGAQDQAVGESRFSSSKNKKSEHQHSYPKQKHNFMEQRTRVFSSDSAPMQLSALCHRCVSPGTLPKSAKILMTLLQRNSTSKLLVLSTISLVKDSHQYFYLAKNGIKIQSFILCPSLVNQKAWEYKFIWFLKLYMAECP